MQMYGLAKIVTKNFIRQKKVIVIYFSGLGTLLKKSHLFFFAMSCKEIREK